ncbi:MAG TPA: hypothetical protein VIK13_04685 [Candidatus Limnocylindrales bacterium]
MTGIVPPVRPVSTVVGELQDPGPPRKIPAPVDEGAIDRRRARVPAITAAHRLPAYD